MVQPSEYIGNIRFANPKLMSGGSSATLTINGVGVARFTLPDGGGRCELVSHRDPTSLSQTITVTCDGTAEWTVASLGFLDGQHPVIQGNVVLMSPSSTNALRALTRPGEGQTPAPEVRTQWKPSVKPFGRRTAAPGTAPTKPAWAGRPTPATPPSPLPASRSAANPPAPPAAAADWVAAQEVIRLLRETSGSEQHEAILAVLTPLDALTYAAVIDRLAEWTDAAASTSYLESLYRAFYWGDTWYGDLRRFLALHNLKMLAAHAGSIENVSEALGQMVRGGKSGGADDSLLYQPSRMTKPSTWSQSRVFPKSAEFEERGTLDLNWMAPGPFGTGLPWLHQLGPRAIVRLDNRDTGRIELVTQLELKALSDANWWEAGFAKVNTVGIVAGGIALLGARTVLEGLSIAAWQVLVPGTGQFVTENYADIAKLKHGQQFLDAWRIFEVALAGYGVAKLLAGGASIVSRLRANARRLRDLNPESAIAREALERAEAIEEELAGGAAKRKSRAKAAGVERAASKGGEIPDTLVRPHIKQTQEYSCGAACATMLARFHGVPIDEAAFLDESLGYDTSHMLETQRGYKAKDLAAALQRKAPVAGRVWIEGYAPIQDPEVRTTPTNQDLYNGLKKALRQGSGICMVQVGTHWVVVDGLLEPDGIVFRDPAMKEQELRRLHLFFSHYDWSWRGQVIILDSAPTGGKP